MTENIYQLKKFIQSPNVYGEFDDNLIVKRLNLLQDTILKGNKFYKPNSHNFSILRLPESSYQNLQELLNKFELQVFERDFLYYIALTQNSFLLYKYDVNQNVSDRELLDHFIYEKKDLNKLMNILELFVLGDKGKLKSISFKFSKNKTQTINNFFVIYDIYESIIESFGLNENNFDRYKKKILEKANNFDFKKGDKYVKMIVIQNLCEFLKYHKSDIKGNQALRFCGLFLHICQIPSNNEDAIDISIDNINDSLNSIDVNNLRHYKNGRISFKP